MTSTDQAAKAVRQIIGGVSAFEALYTFAALKVADYMVPGPRTAADLSHDLGVSASPLGRIMRYLAGLGVLRRVQVDGVITDGDMYELTLVGELLITHHPDSQWPMVIMRGLKPWRDALADLSTTVRRGAAPMVLEHGGIYGLLQQEPELRALFDAAMESGARQVGSALASQPELTRGAIKTIVDVAGGTGTMLRAITHANPHVKGVLVDLPESAGRAARLFATENLATRVQARAADIFSSPLPAGADAYLLSRVIHNHPRDRVLDLMRNIAHVMPNHSELWVIETPLPEQDRQMGLALDLDLVMLGLAGGRERTEEEYRALAKSAGFQFIRRATLPLDMVLMVFTRADLARNMARRRRLDTQVVTR
ncbi:methyltransferase [Thermopolyspora sp. NPDC052614]|uniref:methyltransferase n=1 Tax=Thermopolyspora sp. NPDC052614 TaxID=3155682 RepID=UPI003412EA37